MVFWPFRTPVTGLYCTDQSDQGSGIRGMMLMTDNTFNTFNNFNIQIINPLIERNNSFALIST